MSFVSERWPRGVKGKIYLRQKLCGGKEYKKDHLRLLERAFAISFWKKPII